MGRTRPTHGKPPRPPPNSAKPRKSSPARTAGGCRMSENQTPEEQLAEVARAALAGGLFAFEHDSQLQAQQLREQLDLLGKGGVTQSPRAGRILKGFAMPRPLLPKGEFPGFVRRFGPTLKNP